MSFAGYDYLQDIGAVNVASPGRLPTNATSGAPSFFSGLSSAILTGVDGYARVQAIKDGRTETIKPAQTITDTRPESNAANSDRMFMGNITQTQALMGIGGLLVVALLLNR